MLFRVRQTSLVSAVALLVALPTVSIAVDVVAAPSAKPGATTTPKIETTRVSVAAAVSPGPAPVAISARLTQVLTEERGSGLDPIRLTGSVRLVAGVVQIVWNGVAVELPGDRRHGRRAGLPSSLQSQFQPKGTPLLAPGFAVSARGDVNAMIEIARKLLEAGEGEEDGKGQGDESGEGDGASSSDGAAGKGKDSAAGTGTGTGANGFGTRGLDSSITIPGNGSTSTTTGTTNTTNTTGTPGTTYPTTNPQTPVITVPGGTTTTTTPGTGTTTTPTTTPWTPTVVTPTTPTNTGTTTTPGTTNTTNPTTPTDPGGGDLIETIPTTDGCSTRWDKANNRVVIQAKTITKVNGVVTQTSACEDTLENYAVRVQTAGCSDSVTATYARPTGRYYWTSPSGSIVYLSECTAFDESVFPIGNDASRCAAAVDLAGGIVREMQQRLYVNANNDRVVLTDCSALSGRSWPIYPTAQGCGLRHDFTGRKSYQQSRKVYDKEGQTTQVSSCADATEYAWYSSKAGCEPHVNFNGRVVVEYEKTLINYGGQPVIVDDCHPSASTVPIAASGNGCEGQYVHLPASNKSFPTTKYSYNLNGTVYEVTGCQRDPSSTGYDHQLEISGYQNDDANRRARPRYTKFITVPGQGRIVIDSNFFRDDNQWVAYAKTGESTQFSGYTYSGCARFKNYTVLENYTRPDGSTAALPKSGATAVQEADGQACTTAAAGTEWVFDGKFGDWSKFVYGISDSVPGCRYRLPTNTVDPNGNVVGASSNQYISFPVYNNTGVSYTTGGIMALTCNIIGNPSSGRAAMETFDNRIEQGHVNSNLSCTAICYNKL